MHSPKRGRKSRLLNRWAFSNRIEETLRQVAHTPSYLLLRQVYVLTNNQKDTILLYQDTDFIISHFEESHIAIRTLRI